MDRRYGRVEWGPGKPRSPTKTSSEVRKWNRQAQKDGTRPKVFCASLADWLDDEVPASWREMLFDLIEECTSLIWLMLTKRPENYDKLVPLKWLDNPLPHVWPGVTAENQKYWNVRVPMLAGIPKHRDAFRWVSYEPALSAIDISDKEGKNVDCREYVDWIIIGGESDQMNPAREFHLEWARSMIKECRKNNIVPFVKQFGSKVFYNNALVKFESKDGSDPKEWPAEFQIREFPCASAI